MCPLTATVPHGDEGGFGPLRHLHHFGNFECVHFAHASTMNAEILCEAVHPSTLYGSLAGNNAVAERLVKKHVVVIGSMGHKRVHFEEGAFVEQQRKAIACCATTARPDGFLPLEASTHASCFSL